jgi:hypothetical protein
MRQSFLQVMLVAGALLTGGACPAVATDAPTAVDLSQEPTGEIHQQVRVVDTQQRYALWVQASNTRVTVRVNDIPVAYRILRNNELFDISFNEWLKRDLNVVDINMERFNNDEPYDLRYQVYYQSPIQVVNGEKLVLYNSPDEVSLPLRQPVGIRVSTIPALRIWQADEVTMNAEEQQRLLETINGFRNRLSDAVLKADNAFLASYDKASRNEVARAYGRNSENNEETLKRRRELVVALSKLVNAPFSATPLLKIDDITFEPIADGHLIMVSRNDGSPLIQVKRGDLIYTIDRPIFGNVGGVWELLR